MHLSSELANTDLRGHGSALRKRLQHGLQITPRLLDLIELRLRLNPRRIGVVKVGSSIAEAVDRLNELVTSLGDLRGLWHNGLLLDGVLKLDLLAWVVSMPDSVRLQ